jgi:hypothetical protein
MRLNITALTAETCSRLPTTCSKGINLKDMLDGLYIDIIFFMAFISATKQQPE